MPADAASETRSKTIFNDIYWKQPHPRFTRIFTVRMYRVVLVVFSQIVKFGIIWKGTDSRKRKLSYLINFKK